MTGRVVNSARGCSAPRSPVQMEGQVAPLAYGLKDAGRALGGVSPKTLYRWARAGKLDIVRLGGRSLVARAELERLLAKHD